MIFACGIHGVGKTYFCEKLSKKLQIESYSAGKLISDLKKEQFKKDKRIADIDKNQDYLVTAVNKIRETNKNFILDGHCCLLDFTENISRIPYITFQKIKPEIIIALHAPVELIVKRLEERDNIKYSKQTIENFQNEELIYAKLIAKELSIKCLLYNSLEEINTIINFIKHNERVLEI